MSQAELDLFMADLEDLSYLDWINGDFRAVYSNEQGINYFVERLYVKMED